MNFLRKLLNFPVRICNWFLLKYKGAEVGNRLQILGRLFITGQGKIYIGDDVRILSSPVYNLTSGSSYTGITLLGGELYIGNRVKLSHCAISVAEHVVIEDDVMIGSGTMITDTDFHSLYYADRVPNDKWERVKKGGVVLQQGCFIGARCIILKGVTVGKKSVVGAGSVVTRSIPAGEIWGGNPARLLRKMSETELLEE